MDFKSYDFTPRELIAALMYLVIGHKNTMMVFGDFYSIAIEFSHNAPIEIPGALSS